MKKSLLALAALTAFAGAASAQSSMTIYGRSDLSIGKPIGTKAKGMFNGSGSRLGFSGVEDLGGGLRAFFTIEHRFQADTGSADGFNTSGLTPTGAPAATSNNNRFWGARSYVGLRGNFGELSMGREYTTAFLVAQLAGDPWGWDTIAAHADITGLGGIAKVRNDSALTYKGAFGGFGIQGQIAEATDAINNFAAKPVNFAVSYSGGPLLLALGVERTGREVGSVTEQMTTFTGAYRFGPARISLNVGRGDALNGNEHSGMLVGFTWNVGAGQLRLALGNLKAETPAGVSTTLAERTSFGYHHNLSKRSTLYFDVSSNGKAATEKTGFDVGLKHNF